MGGSSYIKNINKIPRGGDIIEGPVWTFHIDYLARNNMSL